MSQDSRVLLVTGATGNQGGAVVDALIKQATQSPQPLTILGVTRNPDSASAQKLAAKSPLIKLLKGDLTDPAPLFTNAREITKQPVWGVFSIQTMGKEGEEEAQGKKLIDESIKQGVKHFVQTSVDRGGDEKSWTNPTDVPHFISKHNIELHLRDRAAQNNMTWTILRPVAFFDNFSPGFGARVFLSALKVQMQSKPLQFVAVRDIGIFGAKALLNASDPRFRNQAIGLAGDSLSAEQMTEVFKAETRNPVTPTFGFLGSAFVWGVKEMGLMIKWFAREGYAADVGECRKVNPGMMDMRTYLREESSFDVKK